LSSLKNYLIISNLKVSIYKKQNKQFVKLLRKGFAYSKIK